MEWKSEIQEFEIKSVMYGLLSFAILVLEICFVLFYSIHCYPEEEISDIQFHTDRDTVEET